MSISDWINPFHPADGAPPQTLGAFMRWCLSGAWPVLWLAAFLSAAAGAMEAGTAWILGRVIDATVSAGPERFFEGSSLVPVLGAVAFFLVARPVLFGLSSASNAIMVQPKVASPATACLPTACKVCKIGSSRIPRGGRSDVPPTKVKALRASDATHGEYTTSQAASRSVGVLVSSVKGIAQGPYQTSLLAAASPEPN